MESSADLRKREGCVSDRDPRNQRHDRKLWQNCFEFNGIRSVMLYGHLDHDLERLRKAILCSMPLKVNARYVKLNMSNPLQN